MKIKITHPIITETAILQAGHEVQVSDELARKWIENEWAFQVDDFDEKDETVFPDQDEKEIKKRIRKVTK